MKKAIFFIVIVFAFISCGRRQAPSERIEGPFLILSTPYFADGAVDYASLVEEARFAASWDTPGIIWPQSNDAVDLLTREEKFAGMAALVKAWAEKPCGTVLTLGVNGDDTADMMVYAREAERLAEESGVDIALCARPPYYGMDEAAQQEYFDSLASIAKHPVIIQTYVNEAAPVMSVDFLVALAKKYPDTYGWIKEESNHLEANARQQGELAAKPYIKTVFSAWGGWQWLYQRRQIGTAGLISEKIAYAPITSCVWQAMKEDREDLTEAYAMYRLMIDQRFLKTDALRGYALHYLVRLGIFENMVSRVPAVQADGPSKTWTPGTKGLWKLHEVELTPMQTAELDRCYDDMMAFVNKHYKR